MTQPNNLAYREYLDELLSRPMPPFAPFAEYDADGDCIEFFAKPDPYFAERIDPLLTVYRSQETKEIVGSLIKGVSHVCREILEKHPNFRVEVHDGKIRLVHIFRAKLWSLPRDEKGLVEIYRFLTEEAERSKAEVDATVCASA
jgi:hypothetical protein